MRYPTTVDDFVFATRFIDLVARDLPKSMEESQRRAIARTVFDTMSNNKQPHTVSAALRDAYPTMTKASADNMVLSARSALAACRGARQSGTL